MAFTRAPIFTPIEDKEISEERPVSEETVIKLIRNCNMLAALAPVGTIRAIQINLPGVPVPSVDQFQYCNGTAIENETSPIKTTIGNTKTVPNLANRFIRGASDESSNELGGNPTINLSHTHPTGFAGKPAIVGEEGNERQTYDDTGGHTHTMPNDLRATEPLDPAHQQMGLYLKIN